MQNHNFLRSLLNEFLDLLVIDLIIDILVFTADKINEKDSENFCF